MYFSLFIGLQTVKCESESCSVMSDSLRPHELYRSWNSPGQNTGMGSFSLLQGIFPTQDWMQVSCVTGGFFINWAIREALLTNNARTNRYQCGNKWSSILTTIYIQKLIWNQSLEWNNDFLEVNETIKFLEEKLGEKYP